MLVQLVDGVVGQVTKAPRLRVHVICRVCLRLLVLGSSEPSQSFLVDVDTQGLNAGESHVDAEVKLEAVDEERPVDVVTRY